MTEDWRRAFDRKQVVGVVFIDFRPAELQGLGIAGYLWYWIRNYLTNRTASYCCEWLHVIHITC